MKKILLGLALLLSLAMVVFFVTRLRSVLTYNHLYPESSHMPNGLVFVEEDVNPEGQLVFKPSSTTAIPKGYTIYAWTAHDKFFGWPEELKPEPQTEDFHFSGSMTGLFAKMVIDVPEPPVYVQLYCEKTTSNPIFYGYLGYGGDPTSAVLCPIE